MNLQGKLIVDEKSCNTYPNDKLLQRTATDDGWTDKSCNTYPNDKLLQPCWSHALSESYKL